MTAGPCLTLQRRAGRKVAGGGPRLCRILQYTAYTMHTAPHGGARTAHGVRTAPHGAAHTARTYGCLAPRPFGIKMNTSGAPK
eukprot:gene10812-biopygen4390